MKTSDIIQTIHASVEGYHNGISFDEAMKKAGKLKYKTALGIFKEKVLLN
jgi:hypothetical protein